MTPFDEAGLCLSAWGEWPTGQGGPSGPGRARLEGPGFLVTQAGALPGPLALPLP